VDWHSVSGLTVSGCELMRQRLFAAARQSFEQCLQLDPLNRTALCRLAELELRRDCPDSAAPWIERALAIDTYDATANWLAACLARRQNRLNDALVSLDFAARDLRWRATALGERSKVSFLLADPASAEKLARQALEIDPLNLRARELLAVSLRRQNRSADALECLAALQAIDPLSHFCRFERSLLDPTARNISAFRDSVRGELPHESFLELALSYVDIGATAMRWLCSVTRRSSRLSIIGEPGCCIRADKKPPVCRRCGARRAARYTWCCRFAAKRCSRWPGRNKCCRTGKTSIIAL
jgi:tetratricopeptide (TPR) repeat protein